MAEDHVDSFHAEFSKLGRKFGDPVQTQERLKAERRAGLTPKQRGKKSKAKTQLNTRASDETHELIAKLIAHLTCTKTDVVERAIAKLAELEGVK